MEEKTYEWCPYCDTEVELDAELKVQTCPNCGKRIVTCSMCRACDANDGKHYCSNCCLAYQEDIENKEMEEEQEVLKPTKIKKVYRFWSQHWVDIEVEGADEDECVELAQDKYNNGEYDDDAEDWENTDMEDITEKK